MEHEGIRTQFAAEVLKLLIAAAVAVGGAYLAVNSSINDLKLNIAIIQTQLEQVKKELLNVQEDNRRLMRRYGIPTDDPDGPRPRN